MLGRCVGRNASRETGGGTCPVAKQSLVQGLYSQRGKLLETQEQARRELAELEARLAALHLPFAGARPRL